jgi:hypothetical protein
MHGLRRLARAVVPKTYPASAIASRSVSVICAACKIFPELVAIRNASSFKVHCGLTRHKRAMPMFFIARATEPTFPEARVPTRIILILSSTVFMVYTTFVSYHIPFFLTHTLFASNPLRLGVNTNYMLFTIIIMPNLLSFSPALL